MGIRYACDKTDTFFRKEVAIILAYFSCFCRVPLIYIITVKFSSMTTMDANSAQTCALKDYCQLSLVYFCKLIIECGCQSI